MDHGDRGFGSNASQEVSGGHAARARTPSVPRHQRDHGHGGQLVHLDSFCSQATFHRNHPSPGCLRARGRQNPQPCSAGGPSPRPPGGGSRVPIQARLLGGHTSGKQTGGKCVRPGPAPPSSLPQRKQPTPGVQSLLGSWDNMCPLRGLPAPIPKGCT